MADESNFIVQLLLEARDNATSKVAALRAEVAALKREAEGRGGGAASPVARDLDNTGRSARDAERDLRGAREEHERTGGAARRTSGDLDRATRSTEDHRSAASRLGDTLGDTNRKFDESGESTKKAGDKAAEAAKSYEMFDEAVRRGGVNADDARRGYAQFSQELGGIARGFKAGSEEAQNFSRIASEAKARSGDFGPSEADIRRVEAAYKDFDNRVKSGVMTTAQARRGYKDLSSELGSIGRAFRAGSSDAEHFLAMAEQAGSKAKKAAYLSPGEWNWDTLIAKTAARFDDWGVKVVSLSANLRGLALAGIIGLAQQLDTAVVGLAGGLFSVASAAVQAGAALGGALVAGISQAIPVLAVVAATVERLKSVFQAVGLQSQAKVAQETSPNKTATTQLQNSQAVSGAEHALANAYEGVATAQMQVRSTQEALTLARVDAIRNITDLTLAEKDAKLQAEGASLSLLDAQRALQQAVQQGNTAGIQQAQLGVQEAELAQQRARDAVPRAEQDADRARRQGVDRNPSVVSASQASRAARAAVANQQFAVQQAQAQLKIAQLQKSEPSAGVSSQQSQLNALKKNFTAPEKALYDGLVRIEEMVKSPSGPLAKVSEYLVEPFAKGVGKIANLLNSKTAMAPLDGLAKSIGGALSKVEGTLTNSKSVSFFGEMADDASKNVPLIAHAFDSLLGFFQDVAKTASPFLHDIVKGFDDFATNLNSKFSSTAGLDKLRTFFDRAEGYARDIGHMAGAFGSLMMALGRNAAPSGDSLINSLTNSMNKATEWVDTHGPEVKRFFEQTGEVVRQIGYLLLGVGKSMITAFNPSSTAALQQFLTQIILPALTKVVQILGWITTAIMNIAKAIPGGTASLQIIAGIVATIFGIGKLYEPVAKIYTIMGALVAATKAFTAASGMSRITAAWEAFHGIMSKVKDTTEGAAAAQEGLNTQETLGATAATADAGAQAEVAAAEGAGAAGGAAGVAGKLGKGALIGGATVAGLYGIFGNKGAEDGTGRYGLPTGSGSFGAKLDRYGAKETNDLTHLKIGDFFSGIFGSTNDESKAEEQLRKFGNQISKIKGSLSDLPHGKMMKIHEEAARLGDDPSLKKFKGSLEDIANATDPSLIATKKWSEKMKEYLHSLGPAAKSVAETFQSINQSTGSILEQIREVVHTNSKKIAEDLGTNTREGKDALIANFGQAVDAINASMAEGTVSTGKGMQEIGRLVSTALKEYGINPSQINKYVAATTKLTNSQQQATSLHAAGFEAGGWAPATPGGRLYQAGEGGHEEVVLTTDPKHAARQQKLLGEYVQRAPHVMGSYAEGGFVGDPGKDFSFGKEPQIVAALRKLGQMLHTTIYGISGHRTPAESVAVGGFADDPHTRGEAADIGVGSQSRESAYKLTAAELSKVGLYRPFYPPDPKEVNHVQLLAGAATSAAVKGAQTAMSVMASGYEIAAPKVKGLHGQLQKIAQGALNKVSKAAGEYVQKTVGTLPTPELGPGGKSGGGGFAGVKGKGGSPAANEKLGREMMIKDGFPASEWDDLKKLWTQESGWSDTAENNPSMGWLANGNASGIPQSDGHGQVYAKGEPRGQIAWGLKYIKERYGSIAKAWASEMAIKSYAAGGLVKAAAMALGGKVASWGGRPQMIEAHEGERVMNPMQYSEAARLAGTTPGGLDKHMGYDGRPRQSFDVGGIVPPRVVSQHAQPGSASVITSAAAGLDALSTSALSNNSAIVKVFKAVHDGFVSLGRIEKKAGVFTSAVIPFIESITNESTGVIARLQAGFTAMTSRLTSATSKANFKPIKSTVQSGRLVSSASPLEQTDRSLKDLATERKNLEEQAKIIADAEKQIQKRIKALEHKKQTSAVKKELQQLVGAYNSLITSQQSIEEQTAQNLEAAAQAAQQRVQDIVTNINNTIGLEGSKLQAQQGSAQALGRLSELPAIDAKIAENARSHIQALEGALNEANAIGNSEMAASIRSEIVQLQQAVTTAAAQAIQDAEAAIQQQAGIQSARAGFDQIRATVAAAQGRFTGQGGELSEANLGYRTEINSAQSQLGSLRKLLVQAQGEGNEGQIATLTESILALEGSILQNKQAIKDNTAIVTQAYIAQVTRQGQFATGTYGGLISLLQTTGSITGQTNVGAEAKLYEQSNKSLEGTNKELIGGSSGLNSFLQSLGINEVPNLEGLSGEALVNAISELNLSGIESHMDPAQQQTFEQIIMALVQNSETIETNNHELADLNGQLTQLQTFSTSVFSKFRDSIFTGVGGLLPSYAEAIGVAPNTKNPGLTGAGSLEPPGSSGATRKTPGYDNPYAQGAQIIEKQEVNINTPDAPFDPAHAGRVIAFSMKTPAP